SDGPLRQRVAIAIAWSGSDRRRLRDFQLRHVPDKAGAIAACCDQALAVRREGDEPDHPFVTNGTGTKFTAAHFPDRKSVLRARRGQELSVRREREGTETTELVVEATGRLAAVHVPDDNETVFAGGGQGQAVGREGQGRHAETAVSVQPAQFLP